MSFIELLLWLWIGHCLCDYPLQNDYLARTKARFSFDPDTGLDVYNQQWVWSLTAHASIHALPVMWLTGDLRCALFMIATHWVIDFLKCEDRISLAQDQWLHVAVITIIALVSSSEMNGYAIVSEIGHNLNFFQYLMELVLV